MAASILGQSGMTYGTPADTSLIITQGSFRASVQTKEVMDHTGVIKAVVSYAKKGEHNFSAVSKVADTDNIGGQIGQAMSILGVSGGFGITGGVVVLDSIDRNFKNEDFFEVSGQGSRYPHI